MYIYSNVDVDVEVEIEVEKGNWDCKNRCKYLSNNIYKYFPQETLII